MSKSVKVKNLLLGKGRPKIAGVVLERCEDEILDLCKRSNEESCDLIEFRLDHFEGALDFARVKSLLRKLRHTARKPILLTFRSKREGGEIEIPVPYYEQVLTFASESSLADLIDIEAAYIIEGKLGGLVKHVKGRGLKVVVSKHDFSKTPSRDDIIKDYRKMEELGADIVKFAYMPRKRADVVNLFDAAVRITSDYSAPLIAISMGNLGMISRFTGEFLESAITFASIKDASAPGQIDVKSLNYMLNVIHSNLRKVFLVGFMGTGKTAVSNHLALKYGFSKMDLDANIEKAENMSIADLKRTSDFKEKERKHLKKALESDVQLITLGAGIIENSENIDIMKEKGIIVLLRASAKTVLERVKNAPMRNVVASSFDEEGILALMEEKKDNFERVADVIIDTDDLSVDEISRKIAGSLGSNE